MPCAQAIMQLEMRRTFSYQAAAAQLLAVASLFIPWSQELQKAGFPASLGWQLVPGWLALTGVAAATLPTPPRAAAAGLALAAAALIAWPVDVEWQTGGHAFSRLGFEFHWVDVTDVGWILGVLAWLLAADFRARRAAGDDPDPTRAAVLAWSLTPGAGLVRQHLAARGRVWMVLFVAGLFLLHLTAVPPIQVAFGNATGALPLPATRAAFKAGQLLVLFLWAAAAADSALQWRAWIRQRRRLPTPSRTGA